MVDFGGGKKASHPVGDRPDRQGGAGGDAFTGARRSEPSFSDVVGQERLKRALLAVGANDDLGGLLIQGEKGTAKSTAVRALSGLLGTQQVIQGCPYGCPPDTAESQCEACRNRSDPETTDRPVPLVTVPLGATRERVVGTLSVADALAGDYEFDPGLLARANRGILYVDEVNLLPDHLVDVLLDAAASGTNRVERDGVSVTHPASFTLVGTMNPEEGDLRPQLRDRFALQVSVTACEDIDQRVEIVERAVGAADAGRDGGAETAGDDHDWRAKLHHARDQRSEVELPEDHLRTIARLCREAGVDGHRGDIAIARTARTFAALDRRSTVIESDVREAATFALPHRLQSRPFQDAPDADDIIDEQFEDPPDDETAEGDGPDEQAGEGEDGDSNESDGGEGAENDDADSSSGSGGSDPGGSQPERENGDDTPDSDGTEGDGTDNRDERGDDGTGDDEHESPARMAASGDSGREPAGGEDGAGDSADGAASSSADGATASSEEADEATPLVPGQSATPDVGTATAPEIAVPETDSAGEARGNRVSDQWSVDGAGPRVRSRRADETDTVDAAASVRAAATRGASTVKSRDLRQSVRASDGAALVLFVVDASASMQAAMRTAKGTVVELLKDAYQQRDEVGFVAFAGDSAEVLLPPTDSVTLAARHLKDLPTGDRTPLPAGLRTARDVIDRSDPAASVVVLVTDGRGNVAAGSPVETTRDAARELSNTGAHVVVVDAGDEDRAGLIDPIVEETSARRVPLAALSADRIDATVGVARETEVE